MSTLAMRALMNEVKQRRGARLFDLPTSGQISASDINVELGRAFNAEFNIDGAEERELAGVPSGEIKFSDFHGKSSGQPFFFGIGSPIPTTFGYSSSFGSMTPNTIRLGGGLIVGFESLSGVDAVDNVITWDDSTSQVGYNAIVSYNGGIESLFVGEATRFVNTDTVFFDWMEASVNTSLDIVIRIIPS